MATLHVKNVPEDVYSALRRQARQSGRSMGSGVRALLAENVVTIRKHRARLRFRRLSADLRNRAPLSKRTFLSTEELLREDRSR